MGQHRRLKHTVSLDDRLAEEAKRLRAKAAKLPYGAEREKLLCRASRCDTGAHMIEWLTSPGLQPPR